MVRNSKTTTNKSQKYWKQTRRSRGVSPEEREKSPWWEWFEKKIGFKLGVKERGSYGWWKRRWNARSGYEGSRKRKRRVSGQCMYKTERSYVKLGCGNYVDDNWKKTESAAFKPGIRLALSTCISLSSVLFLWANKLIDWLNDGPEVSSKPSGLQQKTVDGRNWCDVARWADVRVMPPLYVDVVGQYIQYGSVNRIGQVAPVRAPVYCMVHSAHASCSGSRGGQEEGSAPQVRVLLPTYHSPPKKKKMWIFLWV